ncbi:MAG: hypothetical protein K2P81_02880 [Bacteriovoracaceae bacterium]|nr:hypothetical protein [Bacteriovoracaceae bacterium]
MKYFFFFLLTLSSAFASENMKLEVIDTQIGINDYADRPTLCLIVARDVETGKLVGLVEDIYDCFWTRKARHLSNNSLELPRRDFSAFKSEEMLQHLQGFDSQLEFLWSNND